MMSHQQLFEPVLAGEPPARDTLDHLVRRSRRRVHRRRLTATGVGLIAAGVVAALALPGTTPPTMTGAPPTTAASAPQRPGPALLGEEPAERPADAVRRLQDATVAAVTRVVPATVDLGATVAREPMPANTDVNPGLEPMAFSYQIKASVTVAGATGVLLVTVKRAYVVTGCATTFPADVLPSVLRSHCAPNADVVPPYTVETVRDEQPGMIRHVVWLDRQDGTTVEVSVSNEPTLSGAPPITGEQLVEIARDPGLTLYP